ncbi:hypothetical protein [Pseudoxanthomonas sp. PXM02]|uniref:hypothetical protein n=1 Tax=Pseudoxanthomonas sp. PXM02 TaxID=2769294 RepID=UPI001785DE45|nr:hypothetical protein [Pseudoxanthomonas sp. PXM02]MBD9479248.1 hypothetical protein [Pseudoxanthomonas sp. PXM02]
MRFRTPTLAALTLAVLTVITGTAAVHAQDDRGRNDAPPSRERGLPRNDDRGHRNSMSDSVRRVRSESGNQVLSVERMQYDGRDVTRVKYIDDRGRVRTQDDMVPSRRDVDSPVRPRRDIGPQQQPPRGDNPPRP